MLEGCLGMGAKARSSGRCVPFAGAAAILLACCHLAAATLLRYLCPLALLLRPPCCSPSALSPTPVILSMLCSHAYVAYTRVVCAVRTLSAACGAQVSRLYLKIARIEGWESLVTVSVLFGAGPLPMQVRADGLPGRIPPHGVESPFIPSSCPRVSFLADMATRRCHGAAWRR